jgi:Tol biopolymer transport system component
MDEDGTNWTRLTETEADEYAPRWSPDGQKITFISERNGLDQIFVMNSDGSEQTALTEAPLALSPPSWSPDGQYIAFTAYPERAGDEIYVMPITGFMAEDGTGATKLTDEPASDLDPTWSPDGQYIAFISFREGPSEVFYMNADGSRQVLIPTATGSKYGLQWSPDGGRLLFVLDTEAAYAVNRYGLNLMRVTGPVDMIGRSAWSPDASRVIYPSNGDLWVASADGSGAVQLTDDPGTETHPDWWAPTGSIQFNTAPLGPRFNPDGEPWCLDAPEPAVAGNWQVVAPREPVFPGDSAEIGLRNQSGSGGSYSVTARIIAPDETEVLATGTASDDDWIMLQFPVDFENGDSALRGAYTILWEVDGQFVSCDGFRVAGGAGF